MGRDLGRTRHHRARQPCGTGLVADGRHLRAVLRRPATGRAAGRRSARYRRRPAAGSPAGRCGWCARTGRCRSGGRARPGCWAGRGSGCAPAPACPPCGWWQMLGRPSRASSALRKLKSNVALCATSGSPPMKASSSSTISAKRRFALQVRPGQPVHAGGLGVDVALRVDQAVEHDPGRQVPHQLERRDLDDAVAGQRVQPRGFRVEQDGPAHSRSAADQAAQRAAGRAWRDSPVRMTRSARRRFCESGIWRAMIASICSAVMPRRRRTRAICTGRGADTTTTMSTRPLAAGLEQQRHVQHGGRGAAAAGVGEEALFHPADPGMQDRLQPLHRRLVPDHGVAQAGAVEHAILDRAGEGGRDGRQRGAAGRLQAVDGGIRVEHGDVGAAERFGGGRFAHADAAGQPDDPHAQGPAGNQVVQRRVHLRHDAEPGGEAGHGLVQQHARGRPPRAARAPAPGVSNGVSSGA